MIKRQRLRVRCFGGFQGRIGEGIVAKYALRSVDESRWGRLITLPAAAAEVSTSAEPLGA